MLRLSMFGAGGATYNMQPLTGFPNQQPFLLLCYLLLNRCQTHHRERLAAVFWGDQSSHSARKCLRNSLWRLRTALENVGMSADEYFTISEEEIAFLPTSSYWLDVDTFETAVTRWQTVPEGELDATQVVDLEAALELYTGDLLEGIYEDWCLYDRERLYLKYLHTITMLMLHHGLTGAYEKALDYGQRILARDDTHEGIHQQMMWLYWMSGNRSAALAQFKRCTQILHDELGMAPMEKTQQIYAQMVHDEFDPVEWPLHRTPSHSAKERREPGELLTETLLHRVHHLQSLLDQTNIELRTMEHLLHNTMSDSVTT